MAPPFEDFSGGVAWYSRRQSRVDGLEVHGSFHTPVINLFYLLQWSGSLMINLAASAPHCQKLEAEASSVELRGSWDHQVPPNELVSRR